MVSHTLPNGEQMRHCRPIGPDSRRFPAVRAVGNHAAQNSDSGFPQFLFGAYDNPLASLGETQVGFRISAPGPNGCGFDTHHCSFVGTCAIQVVQNGGINNNVEFYLSRACTLREPDLHQTVTLTEAYLRGRLAIGRESLAVMVACITALTVHPVVVQPRGPCSRGASAPPAEPNPRTPRPGRFLPPPTLAFRRPPPSLPDATY